jgi:hypothetical protein
MSIARAPARVLAALPLVTALAGAQPVPASPAPPSSAPQGSGQAADDTTRQQARELGYAGVKAYGAGDYAAASEQLERSYALLPVPSLGLWSARALRKLRSLVEAERRYRDVARMHVDADAPEVQRAAQETAKAELLELLPRIPILRIRLIGAAAENVQVQIDGTALSAERWSRGEPVNPGPHRVVGTHLGEQSVLEIEATEGRESELMLRFTPLPEQGASGLAAPATSVASQK